MSTWDDLPIFGMTVSVIVHTTCHAVVIQNTALSTHWESMVCIPQIRGKTTTVKAQSKARRSPSDIFSLTFLLFFVFSTHLACLAIRLWIFDQLNQVWLISHDGVSYDFVLGFHVVIREPTKSNISIGKMSLYHPYANHKHFQIYKMVRISPALQTVHRDLTYPIKWYSINGTYPKKPANYINL